MPCLHTAASPFSNMPHCADTDTLLFTRASYFPPHSLFPSSLFLWIMHAVSITHTLPKTFLLAISDIEELQRENASLLNNRFTFDLGRNRKCVCRFKGLFVSWLKADSDRVKLPLSDCAFWFVFFFFFVKFTMFMKCRLKAKTHSGEQAL